jgi:cell division protease FtsH
MMGASDSMLDSVDEELRRNTDDCYAEARRLLREDRGRVNRARSVLVDARE